MAWGYDVPPGRDMPVQALIVKEHGDSQTGILLHPLLHRVGVVRHLPRPTLLAGAGDLAQAKFEKYRGTLGKEVTIRINKKRLGVAEKLAILPCAFHLRHFLFQSHAGEQISHPLLDRQFRVLIGKCVLRGNSHGHEEKYGEQTEDIQPKRRSSM